MLDMAKWLHPNKITAVPSCLYSSRHSLSESRDTGPGDSLQAPACKVAGLDLWTSLFTGCVVSNYCFFQSWLVACSYESFFVQSMAGGKLVRELVWGFSFLQKSPSWTFSWKEMCGSNSSESRSMTTKAMTHLSRRTASAIGWFSPPAEPVAAGALARSSGSQRHSIAHPAPTETAPQNRARRAGKDEPGLEPHIPCQERC